MSLRSAVHHSGSTTHHCHLRKQRSADFGWWQAAERHRGAEVLQVRCPGNSCLLSRTHETGSKSSWLSGRLSFCCLRSWCLVLLSGPPVGSGRLALSSGFVFRACFFPFSKKRPRPRAPTQGPIFRQVSQVRTIYLDVGLAIGYLLLLCFFLLLFLCTPSSRFRPTGRVQCKSLYVQSGLSVEVAPFYTVKVGTVYVETVQSSHRLG